MELTENNAVETEETSGNAEQDTQKGKYYTEEEIALIEQKAGDKRISQFQKTLEKKQKESEKLKNMNDTERFQYELEKREQAIAEKERQLALAENKAVASSILSEKGLSLSLVDFVVAEDAEEMNDRIKLLDKAFKLSVKAEVEKRLNSTTPKKALEDDSTLTRESFAKMSIKEQQELYNSNPELYKTLTNR